MDDGKGSFELAENPKDPTETNEDRAQNAAAWEQVFIAWLRIATTTGVVARWYAFSSSPGSYQGTPVKSGMCHRGDGCS